MFGREAEVLGVSGFFLRSGLNVDPRGLLAV